METQYNYQIRKATDKRDWQDIEAIKRSAPDRFNAIQYGRRLARVFNAEIRMTDDPDYKNASGTYLRDECD
ncbi:Addiction module toxin RelE [Sphingobacterium sp. PM2-P1-29]|nr:Addiction module toxin RelE [Sphingobacterium sp. PM2-P1-29]